MRNSWYLLWWATSFCEALRSLSHLRLKRPQPLKKTKTKVWTELWILRIHKHHSSSHCARRVPTLKLELKKSLKTVFCELWSSSVTAARERSNFLQQFWELPLIRKHYFKAVFLFILHLFVFALSLFVLEALRYLRVAQCRDTLLQLQYSKFYLKKEQH